ncbi:kinesin-like protein KIN-14B [Senna tora]|uniref:Kinesin-like protein n=1 Tax=Senna tora TaxID=362788 RepID=A0A834SWU6_9FABA|nr:kinesin-like protein KIN-14B [Senna tora]
MAEQRNSWNWEVSGFGPRKSPSSSSSSLEQDDQKPTLPLVRRYSISTSSVLPHSELSKPSMVASKLHRLEDKVKAECWFSAPSRESFSVCSISVFLTAIPGCVGVGYKNNVIEQNPRKIQVRSKPSANLELAREDYLQLRQKASELQEYSNAKLERVTRYLRVLADKTRRLDKVSLEAEARISPVVNEKRRLFNDLLTSKGNIRVFCRIRPLFEDEGPSVVEFPDDYTIRVNTGDELLSNSKKDFEFDRVYGPHVGQVELFSDVQPLVQSALDGYNVSIFAYGQTNSGKTRTLEGSSYDLGLYAQCFEELFDLANSDSTSTSQYKFSVTVFDLYNEQTRDLLLGSGKSLPKLHLGSPEYSVELVQEKVENPLEFSRVLKAAFQSRGNDVIKINVSHLIVTVHIFYNNLITGKSLYSKLSLVDLAGSEGLITEDDSGERVTDLLHVMKSLSATPSGSPWAGQVTPFAGSLLWRLGDVLCSLTSKKDVVPYENSVLTELLADSLGKCYFFTGSVYELMEPEDSINIAVLYSKQSLCQQANDARKELYEKENKVQDLKQEVLGLKQALKNGNDQSVLLFNEVQKAWKVSSALQTDIKSEHIMLADKHKIEKEQNGQLRNQVAQLIQLEQDQKLHIQHQDSIIQNLQAKIRTLETQLNEALTSNETKLTFDLELNSRALSNSKATTDGVDSSTLTKKLEEELKKRDALIELAPEFAELKVPLTPTSECLTSDVKLKSYIFQLGANIPLYLAIVATM